MLSKAVSQLIWTPPIPEATSIASELRRDCDLVIALTHIGFRQDQADANWIWTDLRAAAHELYERIL